MTNASFPSRTRDEVCESRDRLPLAALLALAMTGFTAIMTETLPAGLLPQLAAGLEVSQAMAGQLVTSYAAGSLIAAIPLTALAQGWRRRSTLVAAIIGFFVFNTVTALSTRYALAFGARFLAGIAAGLAWGILAGYARRMVAGPQQGRALAIAMVGTPLALSLGVPAGAFLGAAIGWRWAFLAMSGTTIALVAWVAVAVPDYPGQPGDQRQAVGSVFALPGVRPILAVVFAWMTAHNVLYTFVAPLAARAGLEGRVDLLLLGFGLSALAGIWLIGVLVDRMLRVLVLASLALFAMATLLLGLGGTVPTALTGSVLAWGLSFGGAATLLQTAIGDAAGEGVDLANAMVTTVWNGAIASGGVIGGLLLHVGGADLLAWAAILFIAAAFLVATAARHRGFVPGPRTQA